jgi:AcrR family transcriptional regulator
MNVIALEVPQPKWTRKPLARPDEVLEAALDLFASNGFAATRMDDIARVAGLSKAAIYLYFPSKNDVFKALVESRIASLRSKVADIAADMKHDPVAGLKHVVQFWAASNSDPRIIALPRIILAESTRFPELAEHYHRVVITQTQSVIVGLIEAGIAQGKFRQLDSKIAARALIAPMLFEMLRRQAFKDDGEAVPLVELSQTFFELFLGGIAVHAPSENAVKTL